MRHPRFFVLTLLILSATSAAHAADVTYFEKDGVTYRQTRQKVTRPLAETRLVDQPRTVYREKVDTELRDTVRTYQIPVTEYRREAYWANRFNPFSKPYLAERLVPTTRWETRTETVKVPVVTRQLIPENTTVRLPVTTQRMVDDEIISTVAVGTRPVANPAAAPTAIASRPASPSTTARATVSSVPPVASTASANPATVPAAGSRYPTTASRYPATTAAMPPAATPATAIGGVSKIGQEPPRVGQNYQWRPGDGTIQR